MKPQHCVIRRIPDSGWNEPRVTLAHVEVEFGHDNVARTVDRQSEKLPIECADAADAYPGVFSVEIAEGAAQLVLPPGGQQGFLRTKDLAEPPTFDLLYQVHGLDPEVAREIYDFQKLLSRHNVWPYGRNAAKFEVIFATEIQRLEEQGPEMGQAEIRRLQAQVAALEAQLSSQHEDLEKMAALLEEAEAEIRRLEGALTNPEAPSGEESGPDSGPDGPTRAGTREARAAELEPLGANELRDIIRGYDIKGASSKSEMRNIILEHEFPQE